MSEKVKTLNLERDHKTYLYFIDGHGSVCRSRKQRNSVDDMESPEVLVPHAVTRDNNYLYFLDKEGDISRSPRAVRGKKATTA